MAAPDWAVGFCAILFLSSMLLWGISWNRFVERSRETKAVDESGYRRTATIVGSGTLCTGLLLALLGFVAGGEFNLSAVPPMLLFLGFAAFPAGFAILITSMFVFKTAALRALYKADGQSESS